MSIIRAIVWGMVDLDELPKDELKKVVGAVQQEAKPTGYEVWPVAASVLLRFRLFRYTASPDWDLLYEGDLKDTCQFYLATIDPENHSYKPWPTLTARQTKLARGYGAGTKLAQPCPPKWRNPRR